MATSNRGVKARKGEDEGVEFRRGPKEFVDRRATPTRAALLCPDWPGAPAGRTISARQAEFDGLARAIHLDIVFSDVIKLRDIRPATFFGKGQAEEIGSKAEDNDVELLLVDAQLSPIQQRNLERETGTKILDRTALILEIFGERAATREGVLQVELAHLNYQKSRLVRSWTHLERQRGGHGFLGGPGETQIEADRRQLQDRIALLEKRLAKVRQNRQLQRGPREAVPFPLVALVGYTNAGKSSLFNRLTGAEVMEKDLLFATLDTTVRKLDLPHGREIVMSDTVGFVADLPTDLVAAFRATLEEVVDADLILHVRDISNPDHAAQADDVMKVLADLGVKPDETPIIEVRNKIDLLDAETPHAIAAPAGQVAATVGVSAVTGEGVEELLGSIETILAERSSTFRVTVPHTAGADLGWLYDHAEIIARDEPDEHGTAMTIRIDPRHKATFLRKFGGELIRK